MRAGSDLSSKRPRYESAQPAAAHVPPLARGAARRQRHRAERKPRRAGMTRMSNSSERNQRRTGAERAALRMSPKRVLTEKPARVVLEAPKHHRRQLLRRVGLGGREKRLLQWPVPTMMRGDVHSCQCHFLISLVPSCMFDLDSACHAFVPAVHTSILIVISVQSQYLSVLPVPLQLTISGPAGGTPTYARNMTPCKMLSARTGFSRKGKCTIASVSI